MTRGLQSAAEAARKVERGRRLGLPAFGTLGLALALAVAGACEPTSAPIRSRLPTRPPATAPATPGGSSAASPGTTAAATAAEHPAGSPAVTIDGTTVTILGQGEKNTAVFALDGTYQFVSTACPGTGVIPFVWVYEEFGTGRGTYVDAVFTVRNLVGNFYLRIQGPPTCDWTVTLTKA